MSQPKVKPLGNRVLVKRSKATATKGGILLPDSAQEKPKQGTVVAVGSGKCREDGSCEAIDLKPGDTILFGAYAGTEVKTHDSQDQNEEYLILSQDEVLGVLTTAK
jgi:chaperonin GroES